MFPYMTTLVLDSKGRIVIPAKVREELGLMGDGVLLKLVFDGSEIKIEKYEGEKKNAN